MPSAEALLQCRFSGLTLWCLRPASFSKLSGSATVRVLGSLILVVNILLSLFSTWLKLSGRAAPSCCKSMGWAGGHYSCLLFVSLWAVLHPGSLSNRSSMQSWNAVRPLSPQLTEAFDKISKQVCSLSKKVAHLQLSMDSLKPSSQSLLLVEPIVPTASCSALQPLSLEFAVEAQVGLSSSLSSVREAVEEWFFWLHGFPAPPTLCEQAVQRGQRLSKKAIHNMSKRRHLPLRIQALATDRCWPLKKAMDVYEVVMQRHKLSLAELLDAVRLSSPVRHPAAKGGKPAQSQHVNRSLGLPLVSVSQFAAWVQQAADDIAKLPFSWWHVLYLYGVVYFLKMCII